VKWAGLALAVAILGALLWNAGELHYKGCVEAAKTAPPRLQGNPFNDPLFNDRRGGGIDQSALRARVKGCSRLP
jgi:hypothetical protein